MPVVRFNVASAKALYDRLVQMGLSPDDEFLGSCEIRFPYAYDKFGYKDVSLFQSSKGTWVFANGLKSSFWTWPRSTIPNDSNDIDQIFDWAIEQLKTVKWLNVPSTTKFKPRVMYSEGEQQKLCL